MGSLDCFRNVLQMEMAWPRQAEGLAPALSTQFRKVRRTLCSGPTSRVKGANANQLILLEVSTKGNSVP